MKTKLFLSILLAALLALATGRAHAQETVRTFTISPPTIPLSIDPGKQTQGTLKISNDSDTPLTFKTSVQDFIVKDDSGTPTILPANTLDNKYSGASWIAVSPDIITIEPHKKAELSYYVQVPADARPGGHYAAVVYTPTNPVGVTGTGASVNTSVGTLVYLTVNGPVSIKAAATKFMTKSIWDFGPATINAQIMNLSDVHIRPTGTITVTNMLGKTSGAKAISEYNIFPGVARNYETQVGKKFMLGYYKANLNATYGPDNLPLIATTSFIVFPWKIAIFIVLVAIALAVGFRYWKKPSRHVPHSPENNGETLNQ